MSNRIDLPKKLKPVYFDFHWSQNKLWALDLPIRKMDVDDFLWLLDYPIWATNPPEHLFDLEPGLVLKNIDNFPARKGRIQNADLSYQINAMYWKGRWVILDGFHRLLKIILQKDSLVKAKILTQDMIPMIQPDPDQPNGFLKYQLAKSRTCIK